MAPACQAAASLDRIVQQRHGQIPSVEPFFTGSTMTGSAGSGMLEVVRSCEPASLRHLVDDQGTFRLGPPDWSRGRLLQLRSWSIRPLAVRMSAMSKPSLNDPYTFRKVSSASALRPWPI